MVTSIQQAEQCDVCGFVWDATDIAQLPERLAAAAGEAGELLSRNRTVAQLRTDPEVWSMAHYGGHMRDVLINLRDRIVLGLVEDNPTPKPMFASARVDLGLYDTDDPITLGAELRVAADLFSRTIRALTPTQFARPIHYGWPRPETRSLAWVAAQALHEIEHHTKDLEALAAAQSEGSNDADADRIPASSPIGGDRSNAGDPTLTLSVRLWAEDSCADDLGRYEDAVLALLAEHAATVVVRLRLPGVDGQPDEMQVLQFAGREALDRYLNDPRRAAMLEERDRVVARTEVTEAVLLS